MNTQTTMIKKLKGHRFLKAIILHVVWLYHRFLLSLRDVSEMMLARGIIISYENIREWSIKFGPAFIFRLGIQS